MDRGYNSSEERDAIESMVMDNYRRDSYALREARTEIGRLEGEVENLKHKLDCAEDDYERMTRKRDKFKSCPFCSSDLSKTIIL